MDRVPISFEYKGNRYSGEFHSVAGAGSNQLWHLMIDNFYYGRLRYTDRWVFDSNTMPEMADFFGDYITGWYQ